MGKVLEFKETDKILRKRLEKKRKEMLDNLYHITRGFEFLGQDPDVRANFEDGNLEL